VSIARVKSQANLIKPKSFSLCDAAGQQKEFKATKSSPDKRSAERQNVENSVNKSIYFSKTLRNVEKKLSKVQKREEK
jgi:hypothetical protein